MEASHLLITKTDNCNPTWFGTHIYWRDTRLLIFCDKDTIVNFSLKNYTGI